jgi:hypothetical protein
VPLPEREKVTCVNCGKWLFAALGLGGFHIEIKCKCGTINVHQRSDSTATRSAAIRPSH